MWIKDWVFWEHREQQFSELKIFFKNLLQNDSVTINKGILSEVNYKRILIKGVSFKRNCGAASLGEYNRVALETSASNVSGHSYIINLVDPTKLPYMDLFIHSKKLACNFDSVIWILNFFLNLSQPKKRHQSSWPCLFNFQQNLCLE